MVRECRLTTARTIPQPIRVYRYQPDPSGKLSIIVTGILRRNDVPRRLKPCHTIFFTLRRFFLTENVLGSRVEGCPCIPWPHLTVGKAIGIDVSLRSTEARLFFFFFFTKPSNPTSSKPSLPYSLPNTTKNPKAKPPFSPLPRLEIQNRQLKLHRLCCVTNPTQAFLNKKDMLHHLIPDYR